MKRVTDYRIRLTGIAVITALRFSFTSSNMLTGAEPVNLSLLGKNLLMTFLTAVLLWETNRAAVVYFNRRHPLRGLSGRRFGREALLVVGVNAATYALLLVYVALAETGGIPPVAFMFFGFFDRLLYGLLVAAFYELLLFMEAWRKATQETEQLKKINLQVQLESLKNQVKPHFLFNSLNTLTGLVEKDTPRAVKFIAELSNVYRYLLQSNEGMVVPLARELQFTQAYVFLLQTRFGSGLRVVVEVAEDLRAHTLPPLTVQLLVENAVKHNQVSVHKPLEVRIHTSGDTLIVENNRQRKRTVASTGMGLSHIAAKYGLLNAPEIIILDEEARFTVKVPLIKPAGL
ncbi:MAG TPA: histidine kinase [Chitinophagaceae bacterium]|nr:histidine kinase [Chitinophagaceae bacterium]